MEASWIKGDTSNSDSLIANQIMDEIEKANGNQEKLQGIVDRLVHVGIRIQRIVLPELAYAYSMYR